MSAHNVVGRRTKVKLAAALVAAAALVTSACGSGGGGSGGGADLTMWTEWSGSYANVSKKLMDDLRSTTGLNVQDRVIDNDNFIAAVRTGLAGNNPPDLIQFEGYQQTVDFAKAGYLLDVTDIWNANKDKWVIPDSLVAACEYDGKMYCIPWSFATNNQYFYNPTILQQHNVSPPKTMEEMYTAINTLRAAGVTPLALGAKDYWPASQLWYLFLAQRCGADTVQQAVKQSGAKWNDPCFTQAATDLYNLQQAKAFNEGVASTDDSGQEALFDSGRTAMMAKISTYIGHWTTDPPPFDVKIEPFPEFSDAAYHNVVVGQVLNTIAISAQTKHPEEARKALEYFTTPEAAKIWTEGGFMSTINGAAEQYGNDATKQAFRTVTNAKGLIPYIENLVPAEVGFDAIYNGSAAVATGTMTPQEFTDSVQKAAESAK